MFSLVLHPGSIFRFGSVNCRRREKREWGAQSRGEVQGRQTEGQTDSEELGEVEGEESCQETAVQSTRSRGSFWRRARAGRRERRVTVGPVRLLDFITIITNKCDGRVVFHEKT